MLRRIATVALLIGLYSASVFTTNGCGSAAPAAPGGVLLGGYVTDMQTGASVRGAEVSVGTVQARTSEQGAFLLRGLPQGEVTLKVTHSRYVPVEIPLTLTAGRNHRNVRLVPLTPR